MSLVDYGFYSDEEEEEEAEEAKAVKVEAAESGSSRRSSSSNTNTNSNTTSSSHSSSALFAFEDGLTATQKAALREDRSSNSAAAAQEALQLGSNHSWCEGGVEEQESHDLFAGVDSEESVSQTEFVSPSSFPRTDAPTAAAASAHPETRKKGEKEAAADAAAALNCSSDKQLRTTRTVVVVQQPKKTVEGAAAASVATASAGEAGAQKSAIHSQPQQQQQWAVRLGAEEITATARSNFPSLSLQQQQQTRDSAKSAVAAAENSRAAAGDYATEWKHTIGGVSGGGNGGSNGGSNGGGGGGFEQRTDADPSFENGERPVPMPELPGGEAPKELLRTVERLRQLRARGITVNGNIAASLDFKNPYLLEKIMKVFDIDPYCSNYPVSVFDPSNVIPWEPSGGAPFAVQLVRRFEQRRQHRRDPHGHKELREITPPAATTSASTAVAAAAAANSVAVSALSVGGSGHAGASSQSTISAETADAVCDGSTGQQRNRSRLERISPTTMSLQQQQQHIAGHLQAVGATTTGRPPGLSVLSGLDMSTAIQQAAFEAVAKAGVIATAVQQQLQQRLLNMQTALAQQQQQQHVVAGSMVDASSAAALAAAAAAAAMAYRSQAQQTSVGSAAPGAVCSSYQRILLPTSSPSTSSLPASTVSAAASGCTAASSNSVIASATAASAAGVDLLEEQRKNKRVRERSEGAPQAAAVQQQRYSDRRSIKKTGSATATSRWNDPCDERGPVAGRNSAATYGRKY